MVIDTLRQGKPIRLQIVSASMSPLLMVGDEVEVIQKPFDQLELGDIVVVQGDEITTTHRLCRVMVHDDLDWLILRGDRRFAYDAPVPAEHYLGVVTARVRRTRRLSFIEGEGRGAWLNQQCQKIADWEAGLFMGNVDSLEWSAELLAQGYNIADKAETHPIKHTLRRTIRLFLFGWTSFLTKVIR